MKPTLVVGAALSLLLSGGKINTPIENSAVKTFSLKTYKVDANTISGVNQFLKSNGPIDQFGGVHHAYTKWDINWSWPTQDSKSIFNKASVEVAITLTVPEWSNPEDKGDLLIWDRYSRAVIAHEMNHIEAAYEAADEILKTIQSLPKETHPKLAKMLIQSRLDELRGFDVKYDRDSKHGLYEGVTLNPNHQNYLNSDFSVLSSQPWMAQK